ncbi:hypothetical protein AVEN_267351-1 [Araneus ventricosus]|uniref:Uncharacterized protein n=1 Tax=Araneus ventricosus TaxID=182803 RepID=A0A4Y2M0X4_ARAVE|nr:hypothetical protein AVEN_267351-1 [Araneus ventricosus]
MIAVRTFYEDIFNTMPICQDGSFFFQDFSNEDRRLLHQEKVSPLTIVRILLNDVNLQDGSCITTSCGHQDVTKNSDGKRRAGYFEMRNCSFFFSFLIYSMMLVLGPVEPVRRSQ